MRRSSTSLIVSGRSPSSNFSRKSFRLSHVWKKRERWIWSSRQTICRIGWGSSSGSTSSGSGERPSRKNSTAALTKSRSMPHRPGSSSGHGMKTRVGSVRLKKRAGQSQRPRAFTQIHRAKAECVKRADAIPRKAPIVRSAAFAGSRPTERSRVSPLLDS